ncbi:hypothetical protein C8R44DRAFT_880689 [Mycena epipterygia]|nr:hypothetical protein C8R44DRAFT_880689 [Mycena epipterygia]
MPHTVGSLQVLITTAVHHLVYLESPTTLLNFLVDVTVPDDFPVECAIASGGVNTVLRKLYTFSMMWTVNARHTLSTQIVKISGGEFCFFDLEHRAVGDAEQAVQPISQPSNALPIEVGIFF